MLVKSVKSLIMTCICLVVLVGCGSDTTPSAPPGEKKLSKRVPKKKKSRPSRRKKIDSSKKNRSRGLGLSEDGPTRRVLPDVTGGPGGDSGTDGGMDPPRPEYVSANDRLNDAFTIIKEAVEYGPTLVVWLFDRSGSAQQLKDEAVNRAQEYYARAKSGDDSNLATAIITFGDKVDFVVDEPTKDVAKVAEGLKLVSTEEGFREQAFLAVRQAIDKYMPFKTRKRHEVLFFVVTDESGDDAGMVESLLDKPRKYGTPFYVIGPAAPFGRQAAVDQTSEQPARERTGGRTNTTMTYVRSGPESRYPERISLEFSNGGYMAEVLDSGFGPFAWEWLCRETGGRHLTVRSGTVGFAVSAGDGKYPYNRTAMKRLAPSYVSEAEYMRQVNSNKASQALLAAAKLRRAETLTTPTVQFEKKSEADLKRALDAAQTDPARLEPALLSLYNLLKEGEGDRDRLTHDRWKANYDLAMGRTLAALARVRGYNSMLALIERGRQFKNANSTTWVLEPAEGLEEAGSTLRRQAEQAKTYLNRVIKEFPDTPWAILAKQELETPVGWKWSEL